MGMRGTSRREIIRAAACGLGASLLPGVLRTAMAQAPKPMIPPPPRRPNIVYVFADQWRATATGYSGNAQVRTPNIDALAKQSVNFQTAVSVCPVCTPYRAALLTGRYPTSTGMFMNDLYLPEEELTLGEVLKQAGYQTAWIGKWHLDGHGRDSFIPPQRRQGFDYWKAAECDHNYNRSHYYTGDAAEKRFWEGYDAFAQTRDARQYIRDHAGRTFALFLSFGPPHYPHVSAPQEFLDLYPPDDIQLPANVPPEMAQRARQELRGYYAHCSALDRCVGELLLEIESAGIAEDTIFVFTSDHGEMMGAHGIRPYAKQVPWDESVRVPMLLRYPLVKRQAMQITEPINTPDIMPTLLSLAGVPIPATVEGEDLSSWIRGGPRPDDRAVLYMCVSPFERSLMREYRAIRTSRYTFVRDLEGPWLMYDDQADPLQMNNLVGHPQYAQLQKSLDERLEAELKRIGDAFHPREYYLRKFGLEVNEKGYIPYERSSRKVQSPRRQ